jgi:hypothetical protein
MPRTLHIEAKDLEDFDIIDPIVHDDLLYLVTRAVSSFYGNVVPTDPQDAASVRTVLGTGGHTFLSHLIRTGRLPIEVFLQVNVDQQWQNTNVALWHQILLYTGTAIDLGAPDPWSPATTLLKIRNHIRDSRAGG